MCEFDGSIDAERGRIERRRLLGKRFVRIEKKSEFETTIHCCEGIYETLYIGGEFDGSIHKRFGRIEGNHEQSNSNHNHTPTTLRDER